MIKKYKKQLLILLCALFSGILIYTGIGMYNINQNMPYSRIGDLLEHECSVLKPLYDKDFKTPYTFQKNEFDLIKLSSVRELRINLNAVEPVSVYYAYYDTEYQEVGFIRKGTKKSSINIHISQTRVIGKSYDFLKSSYITEVHDSKTGNDLGPLTDRDKEILDSVEAQTRTFIKQCG